MRLYPQFLGTNLTEAWLRRYQVMYVILYLHLLIVVVSGFTWTHSSNDEYVGIWRVSFTYH